MPLTRENSIDASAIKECDVQKIDLLNFRIVSYNLILLRNVGNIHYKIIDRNCNYAR